MHLLCRLRNVVSLWRYSNPLSGLQRGDAQMREKQLNPNLAAAILVSITAIVLILVLPVSIRVDIHTSAAQEAKTVEYTVKTIVGQTPPMAFIGVGGSIDGIINPELSADVGDTVKITVTNGDAIQHDLT